MNPNWISKPSDKETVREQYLNYLKLDASNIQKTVNGIALLASTGSSQPPSALPDTRTPTQKRADMERIKIELRSQFKEITTGVIANDIVQDLTPNELLFASNNITEIITELKKANQMKIAPAPVVLEYLRKLMRKYEEVKGVEYGLQQDTFKRILATPSGLIQSLPTPELLTSIINFLESLERKSANQIAGKLREWREILPPSNIPQIIDALSPEYTDTIIKLLNRAAEDMPNANQLEEIFFELRKQVEMNNPRGINEALNTMFETVDLAPQTIRDMKSVVNELEIAQAEQGNTDLTSSQEEIHNANTIDKAYKIPKEKLAGGEERESPRSKKPHTNPAGTMQEFYSQKLTDQKNQLKEAIAATKTPLTTMPNKERISVVNISAKGHTTGGGKQTYKMEETNADEIMTAYFQTIGGQGLKKKIRGKGLAKRAVTEVDEDKIRPYSAFGKYYIHRPKLHRNIIQLRTQKNGVVNSFPTALVSNNVRNILKKIIGGGLPEYDDINELNTEDSKVFSKIIRLAELEEKISVPKKLSGEQKEMDHFNILKGEISAGNNNKELVKEFKLMLLKFVHEGRVPKRIAHEILIELAAQGL
jgi:hypothetical protein